MRVILVEPYNKGSVINVDNNIETFQKLVGGYVEAIYKGNYILLVNEEGRLMRLEENILGYVGNVIIVRNGGEDFAELTDKDIEYFKGMEEINYVNAK
jgi:hypothetical protein